MKTLPIFLMIVGILWALAVGAMFLLMGGISEPVSVGYTSLYYAAQLIGPILLIAGSILVLNGTHVKAGALLTTIGCAVLTLLVIYMITGLFHLEPLQAKPPYVFYACLAVVTLLSDLAAFRLFQLVSFIGSKLPS